MKTEPKSIEIPLVQSVPVYTAKELAAMPLSQMIACRDAQEANAISALKMGSEAQDLMQKLMGGVKLFAVIGEHAFTRYQAADKYIKPRIIRQLAMRGYLNIKGFE